MKGGEIQQGPPSVHRQNQSLGQCVPGLRHLLEVLVASEAYLPIHYGQYFQDAFIPTNKEGNANVIKKKRRPSLPPHFLQPSPHTFGSLPSAAYRAPVCRQSHSGHGGMTGNPPQ